MNASRDLYRRAVELMPGGVNSPVRAWNAVGGHPFFVASGSGSTLYDVDGNSFTDYVCAWGPLILGHGNPRVLEAVRTAGQKGLGFGAPTRWEVELAELICSALPSIQKLRLVSSGTEAAMTALRLARACSGRKKLIKLEGCYHGHADPFLVAAGSGVLTFSLPSSAGVPEETTSLTRVAKFNSVATVEEIVDRNRGEVAAVILEPVCGNCGVIAPEPGFLERLREITGQEGIVLIFDEVITGFRLAWGGAQTLHGVEPDLTCLGKIIGGGLPIGAVGGRRELMDSLAPDGDVYQAGTNSGNPLSVAAGAATLRELRDTLPYASLDEAGARLEAGLVEAGRACGVGVKVNRVGSMVWLYFAPHTVVDGDSAGRVDRRLYARFFYEMLSRGIYWPPSPFEACFLSVRHTAEDVEQTLEAARLSLQRVAEVENR
jgi:glutamate-1-semialdehyde 2,1-aminomutase